MNKKKTQTSKDIQWARIKFRAVCGLLLLMFLIVFINNVIEKHKDNPEATDIVLYKMDKQLDSLLKKDYHGKATITYKSVYEAIAERLPEEKKLYEIETKIKLKEGFIKDEKEAESLQEEYEQALKELEETKTTIDLGEINYYRNIHFKLSEDEELIAIQKMDYEMKRSELKSLIHTNLNTKNFQLDSLTKTEYNQK